MINLRTPNEFFITSGYGESDITIHAGSYHIMLNDMGIDKFNIMTYSSVLPKDSELVEKPFDLNNVEYRGSVLECIMSICNGEEGQLLNAGIIYAYTYQDKEKSINTGGIVCEINGNYTDEELDWKLTESLKEVYNNGFLNEFLGDYTIIKKSFVPQKRYGSVGVALCFINYK